MNVVVIECAWGVGEWVFDYMDKMDSVRFTPDLILRGPFVVRLCDVSHRLCFSLGKGSSTFLDHSQIGRLALHNSFQALDVAPELLDFAFIELRCTLDILETASAMHKSSRFR